MQLDTFDSRRTTTGHGDDALRTTGVASSPHSAHNRHEHEDDRGERGRAEADLRESERLFRTTFERAVVGIAHTSLEGRWLRFNQRLCDLLDYSRDELAARTFQDVTHPDDLAASLACLRRLLAGEQDADELEKRYVRKDGACVWVHVTVSLVRTAEGAPDYFITMVQDITERKRLEQERALLLEQEQAAHQEAEATNAQLQALQALTDTALSHLALDDLLRELLDRVTDVVDVDHAAILLLDEDGQMLTMRAARGLLEDWVRHVLVPRVPVGQGLAGRVATSRAPVIVDDLSTCDLDEVDAPMQERLRSVASVPLLVQDPMEGHLVSRLVGVLGVGSASPRHFTEMDVQLLQRAADRIALAIDRARLYAAEQDARRQAEAALARAQASEAQATARAERLNTILETIADGVVVFDAAGHPVQMNRAFHELVALEYAPARVEALPTCDRGRLVQMRDAVTGAPLAFEDAPAGRALRGEVVRGPGADVRVRAFDGRELELNNSAAPLREPDGRIVGVVCVLRDMSERNRLEREREAARADELAAREASRRMEAFLAVAAHDLRAPLTGVVGYIDFAVRQTERLAAAAQEEYPALAGQIAAVRKRLEDAGQGAARLTRLLSLLFDTAAIRAGKLELHRAPGDLAALVREQVEALGVAAPGRVIRLHMPEGGNPVLVEADADRIGQVVANYLTNALKYAPPDRPVDVSVEARRGRARVAVCDQGPGLPKEERARVWELFHRALEVTPQSTTHGGSLGLGLYISKAIVQAHGGRVGVKSTAGEGSTFWFTLPLADITG
jgi:PAS domain S-box-containing protein